MADAKRDENNVTTAIGLLNTNGTTIMRMYVNPNNGAIKISDGTTGTYPTAAGSRAHRDENNVPTIMGVNESDGQTPMNLLFNSSNELLVDST